MNNILEKYKIQLAELVGPLYLLTVIFLFIYYNLQLSPLVTGYVQVGAVIATFPLVYFIVFIHNRQNIKEILKKVTAFIRLVWPFIFIPLVYVNFYYSLYATKVPVIDKKLLDLDKWLLGGFNMHWYVSQFSVDWLTNWLSFTYGCFFIYWLLVPLVLFLKKKIKETYDCVLAVALASYIGFICYNIFPATGPWRWWNMVTATGDDSSRVSQVVNNFVLHYSNQIDAFPSLHVAITTIFVYYLFKYSRLTFWLLAPFILSIYPATIYLHFHYLIDVLAGFILGLVMIKITPGINKWWFKVIRFNLHYDKS